MRKVVLSILLLLAGAAAPLVAQTNNTPFVVPIYYASSFGNWAINGNSPNTYTFQGRSICQSSGQGASFFTFATNAPVYIQDANSANNETVTPSAIVNTAGSCGVSIAPANQHRSFQLRSGTGGLQEALNTVGSGGGYPTLVQLDRNFFVAANQVPGKTAATVITSVAGGAGTLLQDITAVPYVNYVWNGTAYAPGTWTNAAPTITAGAAAGTGPTIAVVGGSTPLSGSVSLTTGTSTTTGTLFTLTFANSFSYAGTCTATSSGVNVGPAVVETTSGTRVATGAVTVAPTASTAYIYTYACK